MPTVHHPRALDAVDGHPPARVTVAGESYAVADGTVTLPSANAVEQLARAYDLSPVDLQLEDDGDTCEVVKQDGEVCGRELPCPYHSD